jgi:hemolysin III
MALLVVGVKAETTLLIVSLGIYGTALVATFSFSAGYHLIVRPKLKAIFRRLDHAAIFLMIAGTYTPIALVVFPVTSGWVLFGVIWGMALAGIAVRLWLGHLHWGLIPVFLGMGWLAFVWGGTLYESMDLAGVWLLIAGGFCYSGGLVFYLWRTLPFSHAIWHGFSLAGSVTHFVAIAAFALPEA